jgi:hypothetical protein
MLMVHQKNWGTCFEKKTTQKTFPFFEFYREEHEEAKDTRRTPASQGHLVD